MNNQYFSLFQPFIRKKLKKIGDAENFDEDDRATIYIYSSSQKKFYHFGRYSKSTEYNERGRLILDKKDEYIFKVLSKNNHYKYTPNMGSIWSRIKNWKRTMRSKDMYGVPLLDDCNELKIGVVVFQSLQANKYTEDVQSSINNHVLRLNQAINNMQIDPNVLISHNQPLEGF